MASVSTAAIVGIAGLLAAGVAGAQQQPPTFRSGTQVVEVDVRVFDKAGHFVTGLTPSDFQIKEDGVNQPIVSLTLVGPPGALPAPAPSALSAPSAPAPSAPLAPPAPSAPPSAQPPAVWVFLFDTAHLSPAGLNRSRAAVMDFVNQRMHQGDLAGVVADGKMINNRLTTDREELARAADSIRMPGDSDRLMRQLKFEVPRFTDEYEAYMIAERDDQEVLGRVAQRGCADDSTLCPEMTELVKAKAQSIEGTLHDASRLTLMTMRALSHGLARMPGPKTIVYVSEGFLLWSVQSELKETIGEANRAGAHVYAIDARGLNKGHNADLLFASAPSDPMAGPAFDQQVDGPNSLAVDTGGMFIQNENNIGRALDAVQEDAGTYYVLGYTPSSQTFDGKFRSIALSVHQPGLSVRARRGYLAIDPAKMLRPVAIDAAPPVAAAPTAPVTPGPAPAATPAAAPAATSTAPEISAEAIRTRIDRGGLVATLRGKDTGSTNDPASLGWAAYQRGDVETAARELTGAAADPSAHPWVHYVLGLCRLALDEYRDAARQWEQVRAAVPDFEPVYFNLADAYMLQSDDAGAIRVLGDAAGRWASDAEVFDARGVILLRAHAFDQAIDSFAKATKLAPKDPIGFYNLASAHHANYLRLRRQSPTPRQFMVSARERDLAIEAYRRVVKLNGQYADEARKGLKALDVDK